MTVLTYGSICSGYGGLDLAVEEVFGATAAWHAEVDPHASLVLEHHWPGVPNLGDITATDWAEVAPVDIICGGTPCQDLSSAGTRSGMRDGTRSGLWSSMAAAIAVLRPTFVIWENVNGALSACAHSNLVDCPGCVGDADHVPVLRAAGRVLGDLAALGFDAEWGVLAASAVGAPHQRNRLFILAWSADAPFPRLEGAGLRGRPAIGGGRPVGDLLPTPTTAPTTGNGHARNLGGEVKALLPTPRTSDTNGSGEHGDGGLDLRTAVALLPTPTAGDSKSSRNAIANRRPDAIAATLSAGTWGKYAPAIARWEALTRPAPAPLDEKGRLSPLLPEWMMGVPAGWVTDLLGRGPALRRLGNGVVVQQGAAALRALAARATS